MCLQRCTATIVFVRSLTADQLLFFTRARFAAHIMPRGGIKKPSRVDECCIASEAHFLKKDKNKI